MIYWCGSIPLVKAPWYVCTYCECNTKNCLTLNKSQFGVQHCVEVPHHCRDWVWWRTFILAKPRLGTSKGMAVSSLEGFQSLWNPALCCCCAVLSWTLWTSWQMLGTVTGREELGGRLPAYSSLRSLSLVGQTAGCCQLDVSFSADLWPFHLSWVEGTK